MASGIQGRWGIGTFISAAGKMKTEISLIYLLYSAVDLPLNMENILLDKLSSR